MCQTEPFSDRRDSCVWSPLVASSSGKLRRTYGELLALFPRENEHNKAAFFDYLCAMDFI